MSSCKHAIGTKSPFNVNLQFSLVSKAWNGIQEVQNNYLHMCNDISVKLEVNEESRQYH